MQSSTRKGAASHAGKLAFLVWTGLFAASTIEAAPAPKLKLSASTKLDKKTGKLSVLGKTSGLAVGSQVSVFDAANHVLLASGQTAGNKGQFSLTLPSGVTPCAVEVESGSLQTTVKVAGAAKSCSKAPTCSITAADADITAGNILSLTASSKTRGLIYSWSFGDGEEAAGPTASHTYKFAGSYQVTLHGTNATGFCMDGLLVLVSPNANVNPNPKVAESLPRPADASAMPTSGGNDEDAYVVFPFEDTGMEGGSQVTIPFNSLTPYNALNAQVIRKAPHRPEIVSNGAIDVFYSAASNPKDPVGGDSINSTSQNLFANGKVGANYDPTQTTCVSNCARDLTKNPVVTGTVTKLIDGQDYLDATIAKSENWDRSYQPYATLQDPPDEQRGVSIFDAHNAITFNGVRQATLPDQGRRGHVDAAQGVRAMPGISDPYKANVPQKFDYSSDQSAFVAQNIPASDIDDKGRVNPFPLFRVEAKDETGARVAATDAVYTTASETRCRECHAKGQIAADGDVWRTPVIEDELRNTDGTPGPATGEGSFPRGQAPTTIPALSGNLLNDFSKYGYGPAIHNRFDDNHVALADKIDNRLAGAGKDYDANGLRTDRVSASRYWNLKTNAACSKGETDCKLQIKLKFKAAEDYGDKDDWKAQEKAALFNATLMHDYMTKYYYNQAYGELNLYGGTIPAMDPGKGRTGYATAFADQAEEKSKGALGAMCAGHHTSQLKADVGAGAQSYQNGLSNFSGTMHAFHGKFQVYKEDVGEHKKGELIRDERGHPLMYGGRGWDSMHFDEFNVRGKVAGTVKPDGNIADILNTDGSVKTPGSSIVPGSSDDPRNKWDTAKNNWAPETFPMHPKGELIMQFGDKVPMEENCAKCHTGKTEKGYRDIHHAAGLKCDNCHGDMLGTGNSYPNEKYDYNLTAGRIVTGKDQQGNPILGEGKLGDDKANELNAIDFRRYWIDEPDCGSCHVGDANLKKDGDAQLKNYYSAGALKQAWKDGDKSNTSMFPLDARFAVMPHTETRPEKASATDDDVAAGKALKKGDTIYKPVGLSQSLYRKSADVHAMGTGLNCSSCHGGSHAIWPNMDASANDNVTAKQLQGYDGKIVECSTCHVKDDFKTGLIATDGGDSNKGVAQGVRDGDVVKPSASDKAYLAGPHGMHPVNDESFYLKADGAMQGGWHSNMTYKPGPFGEDQCAACHGKDHKGTRLSRTLVDRVFNYEGPKGKKKTIKVAAGSVIGCDLCHKELYVEQAPKGPLTPFPPKNPDGTAGGSGGHGGHG